MKRIGLYVPELSNGGAERVVSRLSKILDRTYKIFIILNDDVVEYDINCEVINLNIPAETSLIKKISLPFQRAKKLKLIKESYELDVVISFLNNANLVNVLSKNKNTKSIVSVRNYSVQNKGNKNFDIKKLYIKHIYRKADFIVPVSIAIEKALKIEYGISSEKIKTIYNPYDLKEITILSQEPILNKEHKKFFEDGKVFITAGRLTYQKGYWHLIKAFSIVAADNDAKLVIIGEGEERSKIEKLINDLNLTEKVLLLGFQKNPFKYISKSYAYILSSLFEGFPNAMVEAMICGCPVIAADCKSGPREILFNSIDLEKEILEVNQTENGLIVPALSFEENWNKEIVEKEEKMLAIAMEKILKSNSLKLELVEAGKKRASQFNYEKCKDDYSMVIENVL